MLRSFDRVAGWTLATAIACGVGASCSTRAPDPFNPSAPSATSEGPWSPDELRRDEIEARGSNDLTAMALIRRLRPAWLRARGQDSLGDRSTTFPVVYIDDIRHGGLETLHDIPAAEILSVRFVGAADATTRWGTGHPSGVINVITGR